MRITNNLLIHNMLWNMNNNLVSMNEKQNQLSTGKKINKASDDPVGTTRVIKVKSDIVENQQYKENVRDAKSWLEVSENSLMDIKDILQRIRELAVQGANGSNTQEDTDKIAKEISQLTEEVIVNSNATMAGRYLFSGFQTDKKLLNEDGTYNIDITSEKMKNFESIAYEVAVGEQMEVGTNYLDVFGAILENNVITDSFVFGDVSNGGSRVGEVEGIEASHSKLVGPIDYTKNLTGETLEITIDGKTFSVDTTSLDGGVSQEEFTSVMLAAKQTVPVPTFPVTVLGDVAEVYFKGSSDTTLSKGEFVIEAKAFGAKAITINDTGGFFDLNPSIGDGVTGVAEVKATIEGNFDYSVDFTGPPIVPLTITVGAKTYTVDSSQLDTATTEAEFIELISNATDGLGGVLTDDLNVTFTSSGATEVNLKLEAKKAETSAVSVDNSGNGYTVAPTLTNGITGVSAMKGQIDGVFDFSKNLVGETLEFSLDGATFSVDTSAMTGDITGEQFLELIKNATQTAPVVVPATLLSDVASIDFITGDPENNTQGRLTIRSNSSISSVTSVADTGLGFVTNPENSMGVSTIEPIKASVNGTIDLSANLVGQDLEFTFASKTFKVSTALMDGSLSEDGYIDKIRNAVDADGKRLSDYMNISFTPTVGSEGVLNIEQKSGESAIVSVLDSGSAFVVVPVTVDGDSGFTDTKAIVQGITKISDEMLSDPVMGVGTQSFVITYGDKASRVDIDMTNINTIDEMKTAMNSELNNLFGDDDGVPPINNVTFNVVFDGSKNVVQFTGSASDDGSKAYLKVDVIQSNKSQLVQDLQDFSKALTEKDEDGIDLFLEKVDDHLDNVLTIIADIGAKDNRMDFIENRIEDNNLAMTKILSSVQDIDFSEVILRFKSLESIYRASLSAGAKVIQPTLVDFIQ